MCKTPSPCYFVPGLHTQWQRKCHKGLQILREREPSQRESAESFERLHNVTAANISNPQYPFRCQLSVPKNVESVCANPSVRSLHTCRLATVEFSDQPTVRDVLERIGQNPFGVKGRRSWGEEEMSLDDAVDDQHLPKVTDQAAERMAQANEALEARLCDERRNQAGVTPHYF